MNWDFGSGLNGAPGQFSFPGGLKRTGVFGGGHSEDILPKEMLCILF